MVNRIVLICVLLLSPVMALATVTGTATTASFTCTGSSGPFPFTFPIDTAAAMTVTQNGTVLSSSAYIISPVNGNYDNGGSVTLNTACPTGETLVLQRVTPITQLTQFTPYMPAMYANIEDGLDQLTEIDQELYEGKAGIGSCPAGYFETADTISGPTCALTPYPNFTTPLPIVNGGTGATTAAGALANLGAVSTATTVNGHALSSNVTVSASDLTTGTLPHAQLPTLLSGDIPNSATAGPVVNLLQYAACDGVTDDRVAIASSLTAAGTQATASGSAYIYVPDGRVCLINSNPNSAVGNNALEVLPVGVGIKGSGTIKIGNGVNFDSLFAWNSPPTPAVFQDFTVDLNGANNPMLTNPNLGTVNRRSVLSSYVSSGNGLTFNNITFKNGNGVWSIVLANISNVRVAGCHWLNWGLNSSVNYDASLIYVDPPSGGSTVINNDFNAGGPALTTAIEVHNSDAVIEGNRVYGFPFGIIYASNPAVVGTTVSRVNITGNVLYTQIDGINIFAQNGPIDTLSVLNNTITMDRQNLVTNQPLTGAEQGITWYYGGGAYGLSHAKFNDNIVNWVTETSALPVAAQLAGISLWNNGGSRNLVGVEVSGNTVSNSPTACFNIYPDNISGLTVRNNTAINCTSTISSIPPGPSSGGFFFQLSSGSKVVDLIVENNHAFDTRGTTKLQNGFVWVGVASDDAPIGASFTGNTVSYTGIANVYFDFYNSGPFINVTAPGAFSDGLVNFVSMTSGNYTPFGSVVVDSATAIPYTNTNSNGLTWQPNYIAGSVSVQGTVAAGTTTPTTIGPNGVLLNGVPALQSQTSLYNYYSGGAGNLTGTGAYNTANGMYALYANTTGYYNSANGMYALYANTTGYNNTANGYAALFSNTTGSYNTANGMYALYANTTGSNNSAQGYGALYANTTGSYNSAQGLNAGRFISDGSTANTTSSNSVYLGANTEAMASGDTNENVIGNGAVGNGSNTTTLGNSSTIGTWRFGTQHITATAPTASAGSVAAYSTNAGGEITGLSAATSVTITFANSGWTNAAFCTANSSTTLATNVYNSIQSKTAVTFTFPALTGNLFYHCDGN